LEFFDIYQKMRIQKHPDHTECSFINSCRPKLNQKTPPHNRNSSLTAQGDTDLTCDDVLSSEHGASLTQFSDDVWVCPSKPPENKYLYNFNTKVLLPRDEYSNPTAVVMQGIIYKNFYRNIIGPFPRNPKISFSAAQSTCLKQQVFIKQQLIDNFAV